MTAPHPAFLTDSALAMVLETALDAAIVMNADGEITAWSRRAEQVFGWPKDEVLGRSMAELIVPPRYREAHWRGLQRYIATGEATLLGRRIEITAVRRSLQEFPIELSIQEIGSSIGAQFIGFLRDITDRKRNEGRLQRQALEATLMHKLTTLAAGPATFEEVLDECLGATCDLTGWPLGHAFIPSAAGMLQPTNIWHSEDGRFADFRAATQHSRFAKGVGLPGNAWKAGGPFWISDVDDERLFPRMEAARKNGLRSGFAFPLFVSGELAAVPEFFTEEIASPDTETLHLVQALAEQVGRVLERKRSEEALRCEVEMRKSVEEHQQLLLHEMDHRVKNMLAVVMGLANQTARNSSSLDAFLDSFNSRLRALSSGYDLLVQGRWKSASLDQIVEAVVCPHLGKADQLKREGHALLLAPKAALAWAMIFHELATNAVKYGALSVPHGLITVTWYPEASSQMKLIWREIGVPPAKPPQAGFGTR